MEPYRPTLRRRLASIREFFSKLPALVRPPTNEVRLQRMCPFCGLITPRAERLCLECGKPLRAIQPERKDAPQG